MRPQFVPSLISLETGFFLTSVFAQQMLTLKEYEKIGNTSDFRANYERISKEIFPDILRK